jgi:hypothetical protein
VWGEVGHCVACEGAEEREVGHCAACKVAPSALQRVKGKSKSGAQALPLYSFLFSGHAVAGLTLFTELQVQQ